MPTSTGIRNLELETILRVSWRLLPFLIAAYLVNYIDRVNVGFAALQMNKAVGIDPKTYGLGAGIFFLGYFLLEVPSNPALQRFGARTWIARIMITWGMVSAACALIGGPTSFLVLRFLLGVAEAGFFPGVILYITYWYPAQYRAIVVGIFMVALPVAGLIGSPISGAILYMDGILGLGGWQWIFMLEAVPAVLLGIASFFYLTDGPEHASWLTPEQRQWLTATLETERKRAPPRSWDRPFGARDRQRFEIGRLFARRRPGFRHGAFHDVPLNPSASRTSEGSQILAQGVRLNRRQLHWRTASRALWALVLGVAHALLPSVRRPEFAGEPPGRIRFETVRYNDADLDMIAFGAFEQPMFKAGRRR